jgi:hypothetical protein
MSISVHSKARRFGSDFIPENPLPNTFYERPKARRFKICETHGACARFHDDFTLVLKVYGARWSWYPLSGVSCLMYQYFLISEMTASRNIWWADFA